MACILLGRYYELTLPTAVVVGTTVAVWIMGVDFGLVAMVVGRLAASRGLALGPTSALAAASFLVSSLVPVVSWAHTIRPLSLFYWAVGGDQLTSGPSASAFAVLAGVAVVLLLATVRLIGRLDIQ